MSELQIRQQVIHRRPLPGSRGTNLIRVGTVLAFKDEGKTAVVSFPSERTRVDIPVDQLQPAQGLYGRAQVHINPVNRGIGFLQ